MLRRLLVWVTCLALVWPSGFFVAHAQSPQPTTLPLVSLVPSVTSVSVGQIFTVQIMLGNLVDVVAADVEFTFDATKVQAVNDLDSSKAGVQIASGTLLSGVATKNVADNTAGTVRYNVAQEMGVNGAGVLATATFQAIAAGTLDFGYPTIMPSQVLVDSSFSSLPYTKTGASVTIMAAAGDTTPPTLAVSPSPATVSTPENVTITVTSNEALTGIPTVTVTPPSGTAQSVSMTAGLSNTWTGSFTVAQTAANGSYAIAVSGQDVAGNAGSGTGSFIVSLDKTAPTFTVQANPAAVTVAGDVSLSVTSSEPISGSLAVSVTPPGGTAQTVTMTAGVSNTWTGSFTVAATAADGSYAVAVGGSDAAGNAGTGSGSFTVSLDKTAPTLTVTPSPATVAAAGDVAITVTSNEALTGIPTVTVTPPSGTAQSVSMTAGLSNTWTGGFTVAQTAANGSYAIAVSGQDVAGNAGSGTGSFIVSLDKTAPTFTVQASPTAVTAAGDVSLSVTSTEPISGSLAVSVTPQGGTAQTVTMTAGASNTWTGSFTVAATAADGSYAVAVGGSDAAGNAGTGSGSFTVAIPPVLFIQTTATRTGQWLKADDLVTIDVTANEKLAAAPVITVDGNPTLTPVATPPADHYQWTFKIPAGADGTIHISAVGTDLAGNSNTTPALAAVKADTSGPDVGLRNPGQDGYVGVKQPTITLLVTDAHTNVNPDSASIQLSVGSTVITAVEPLTYTGSGQSLYFTAKVNQDLPLTDGMANVAVRFAAQDELGNETVSTWTFHIDTNFPVPDVAVDKTPNTAGWFKDIVTLTLGTKITGAQFKWALLADTAPEPAATALTSTATTAQVGKGKPYPEGKYKLWFTTQNVSTGNWSPVLQAAIPGVSDNILRVDNTAPAQPTGEVKGVGADGNSKTYLKAGDSIQGVVMAEANATVSVSGTYQSNSNGTWTSATLPEVAMTPDTAVAGTYTYSWAIDQSAGEWKDFSFTVNVKDQAGNVTSKTFPGTMVVDTVKPQITSVTHNATHPLKKGDTLQITVMAEKDLASNTKVAIYTFDPTAQQTTGQPLYLDVTQTDAGKYTTTYTVNDTQDRVIVVSAVQKDLAGNAADPAAWAAPVAFDVTRPVASKVEVVGGGTLNTTNSVRYYKQGDIVSLKVTTEKGLLTTASDLDGIEVEISGIGAISGLTWTEAADTIASTYSADYTVPAGANSRSATGGGIVKARVILTDAAGNKSDPADSGESIDVDTTNPVYLGVNADVVGIKKAGDSFKIVVGAEPGLKQVTYSFPVTTAAGPVTRTETLPESTPGIYVKYYTVDSGENTPKAGVDVTFTLVDWAGNQTQTIGSRKVIIDTAAPEISAVTVNTPTSGAFKAGDTVTVSFTSAEAGLAAVASVDGLFSGLKMTETRAAGATESTYAYSYTVGRHINLKDAVATVAVKDPAGNSIVVTSDTKVTVDTVPPMIKARVDETGRGLADFYVQRPTITVVVEHAATVTAAAKVAGTATADAAAITAGTLTVGTETDSYAFQIVKDGTWDVTFSATDSAGNSSQVSVPSIKVDTTAPAAPTITKPAATALIAAETVQVTGTVADADVTRVGVYVNDKFRGGADVSNLAFTLNAVKLDEDLQSNANVITAKAIDRAGNSSPGATVTVTRDTSAPTFEITAVPTNKTITVSSSEPISGTVSATAKVDGTSLDITPDSSATDTNVLFHFKWTRDATGDTLKIHVSGKDAAGNVGNGNLVLTKVNVAQGGTVSTDDGNVSANFGSNTLNSTDVKISSYLADNLVAYAPPGSKLLGSAYQFQAVLNVNKTVEVTFTVQMTGNVPPQLAIYYFPLTQGGQIETVLGDTHVVSTDPNGVKTVTVTARLPHFSVWAPFVDQTAPNYVGNPTMTPAQYANSSTNTISIAGMVDKTAKEVKAFLGDTQVGTTASLNPASIANQPFTVTINRTELGADGPKLITVKAYDEFGNWNSQDFTLTLDTGKPTINSVQVNGTAYTNGSTVYTAAPTVNLSGSTEAGALLTVMQGAAPLVSNAQGSFNVASSTLTANAPATVTVTAVDTAGNQSDPFTVTLNRDNSNPTITLTGMGSIGTTSTTFGYSVDEPVTTVTVTADGSATLPVNTFTDQSRIGIALNGLANGTYTITVTATDRAGNVGTQRGTIAVDTALPVVVATVTPNPTNGAATLNVTATKNGTPITSGQVDIFVNGSQKVTAAAINAGGTYTYDLSADLVANTPNGNSVQVGVTVGAGTSTTTINVVKDTVAPDASSLSVSPTTTTDSTGVQFTLSEAAKVVVEYKEAAAVTWSTGYTSGAQFLDPTSYNRSISLPLAGTYSFRLQLTDRAGNTATVAVPGTVTRNNPPVYSPAPQTPAPTVTANAAKSLTKESTVDITGTATGVASVQILQGDTVLAFPTVSAGAFSYTATLVEGENTFTVKAQNGSGAVTAAVSVTRDSKAPVLTVTVPNSPVKDETAALKISSEKGAVISVNGAAVGTADATGALEAKVNLKVGTNTFTLIATDAAGNASAAQTVQIVRSPVEITIGGLAGTTHDATVNVAGQATPGAKVTVTINGTAAGTATAGATGAYSLSVNLTMGANAITATAEFGGATATANASVTRLDTTPVNPPVTPPPTTPVLTDVKGHWAEEAIKELVQQGIITGMGDGTFHPEDQITRAQFAKIMVLALGLTPEPETPLTTTDAATTADWAKGYIVAAIKAGLITGFEDGSFKGEIAITRLQMAVILSRALKLRGIVPTGGNKVFADAKTIPSWAAADLDRAARAGLIAGFEDGTFRPAAKATRAQAAIITLRLLNTK